MSVSPMMQQYLDAKAACPHALLLFRMGDFYELFHDDAKTAARVLNLALTSRDKGENPVPMAGFPYHQLEAYLGKLLQAGLRAAICEQIEDPRQAKGIVKRAVTRIVSPGTVTDDALLDPRSSNYLAAIAPAAEHDPVLGLAWVELSTGRFTAAQVRRERLLDELARIAPVELVLAEETDGLPVGFDVGRVITRRPAWAFGFSSAQEGLTRHFGTGTLAGFGFGDDDVPAIRAAGAVLDYLQETQKASLDHLDRLVPYRPGSALEIDESSRRSLELTRSLRDGRRDGTLLGVIDRTLTAAGSRMLADWLNHPLTQTAGILERQSVIAEWVEQPTRLASLRESLRRVYDIERLLARVTTGRATPRDLSFLAKTLRLLPEISEQLVAAESTRLRCLAAELDLCPDLRDELERALEETCPLAVSDGGFIRSGYHAPLDELRDLMSGGKQWMAQYQVQEQTRTGISSLKIGFNSVFGYYLEITHVHRDKVPAEYIRKQTIKNAERYITPELKDHEEKVLAAEEQARELERSLFEELRERVAQHGRRLRGTADVLAQLDVLAGLADLAAERSYCRPEIRDEPVLEIRGGRHPVLDVLRPAGSFVPNDVSMSAEGGQLLLITGPNMAGKSTFIRQAALLTLLAQIGSFVPADGATIGLADRIFARVGASDELARGQSTFMVEMTETARILNTASPRSLVILDEIGRGTSTYDGVSLAWSIVEYLHERIHCRTLFATHYHELTELERSLPQVRNWNVAVREWQDELVFLHKIVPGAADKSYGIHVARLAGVPREVLERAKQILSRLEQDHLDGQGRTKWATRKSMRSGDLQLTLFAVDEHPLIEQMRGLDLSTLTPLAALQLLHDWQQSLLEGAPGKPR